MRVPRPDTLSTDLPPLERVYTAVFGLSRPTDLSYIAECASLPDDVARDQLHTLSELGIVNTYSYGTTTLYGSSDKYLNNRALWRLCTERSIVELERMEEQVTAQLTEWCDKYPLPSVDDDSGLTYQPDSSLAPLIRGEWLFLKHYRELIRQAQTLLRS